MNGYASKSDRKVTFVIVAIVIAATIIFAVNWLLPRGEIAQIEHGIHTISARVANTDHARQVGLGGVKNLAPNEGMLFVFEQPDNHPIWMKDMEIPIDVIWMDEGGEVIHIEKNMRPESYPASYKSKRPALYVLELGSGATNRMNIKIGTKLDIPESV